MGFQGAVGQRNASDRLAQRYGCAMAQFRVEGKKNRSNYPAIESHMATRIIGAKAAAD
jgi:hypothetical protein